MEPDEMPKFEPMSRRHSRHRYRPLDHRCAARDCGRRTALVKVGRRWKRLDLCPRHGRQAEDRARAASARFTRQLFGHLLAEKEAV